MSSSMWDDVKTLEFYTPAGKLKMHFGFQKGSNSAVSWYANGEVAEHLGRDTRLQYERLGRRIIGANPDPFTEAVLAGMDPQEACIPGAPKRWLAERSAVNPWDTSVCEAVEHDVVIHQRDYDAQRYGTSWVRDAYARGEFEDEEANEHKEMERLIGIALAAGDKTESHPRTPSPGPVTRSVALPGRTPLRAAGSRRGRLRSVILSLLVPYPPPER